MRRVLKISAALGLVLALAPAAAQATTQTASAGSVTATFSFKKHNQSGFVTYSNLRLQIARSGQTVFDAPVRSASCGPSPFCWPGAVLGPSVHVVNLERAAEPDVVLDLYSGGAHCCTIEQVFFYNSATHSYSKREHYFGDPSATLAALGPGGRREFLSADDRFAFAFTDFADSGMPIQIFAFNGGRFVDVTRRHRSLITKDAAMWWRLFSHDLSNGVGLIAAWAGDEELLGNGTLVKHRLAQELMLGHLRSAGLPGGGGKAFIHNLNTLLRRWGYVRKHG
jgi:hypothetical protein